MISARWADASDMSVLIFVRPSSSVDATRGDARAMITMRTRWSPSPQLFPHHELQPGPYLVDRAHLYVHQAQRQRHVADSVLAQIGRHTRRLLRPRYPYLRVRPHRRAD